MYLVANTSTKEITIGDMNISIKPKQALNLHKMESRISPESSKDLAFAEKHGYVKVLKKDSKKEIAVAPPTQVIENKIDTKEIIESLGGLIKQEIQQQLSSKKDNNQDLLKAISDIVAMGQNKNATQNITVQTQQEEPSSLSEEKMAEIHSKAMKKITKGANTSISQVGQEVIDSSFSTNLSELQDLI